MIFASKGGAPTVRYWFSILVADPDVMFPGVRTEHRSQDPGSGPEAQAVGQTVQEDTMKAIVQYKYGSPDDVLKLQDIDKPVAKDEGALIRVHAASVHIGD